MVVRRPSSSRLELDHRQLTRANESLHVLQPERIVCASPSSTSLRWAAKLRADRSATDDRDGTSTSRGTAGDSLEGRDLSPDKPASTARDRFERAIQRCPLADLARLPIRRQSPSTAT